MKMLRRKKVLFICGSLPYPIVSGGRKREFQLLTDLSKLFDIELLCITRNISSDTKNSKYLSKCLKKVNILSANPSSECMFSSKINIENLFKRFHTQDVVDWLSENIKRFDVIHIERSVLFPHILLTDSVPFIISEQSVESETVRQILVSGKINHGDKLTVENYYKDMVAHEKIMWKQASKIITITEKDAKNIKSKIGGTNKVFVIPPKFSNKKSFDFKKIRNGKINLIYLGNFNYFPNVVSVNKIFKQIIPKLKKMSIDYRIRIIGNGANKIKSAFDDEHCEIIDYIEDLTEHWKWAHISLSPIYYGGGIKIKILDSLDNRVPVITTNSGLGGFEHYKNIFVFPRENSNKITLLIKYFVENPGFYSKITKNLANENLHWNLPKSISTSIHVLYNSLLEVKSYEQN